jgi:4-alpha-glucanotransferase
MGDVPIGISYYSADVFFQPEPFDLEWFGGAPPETMFKHDRFIQRWGQNWGVPLYRWDWLEQHDYRWWKQRVRKLTEIFHIFRIDHILGFYRIYAFPWSPNRNAEFLELTHEQAAQLTGGRLPQWAWRDDVTPENRAGNLADGDRRLRAIIDAAGSAEIVGEDLGCVPDYVRPHLESLDIAGFRIPHWDSDQGHVVDGSRLPECSFATYATHDHDTIAALWESFRLDSIGATADPDEQLKAQENIRLMAEFGGIEVNAENPPPYDHDIQWKLLDALLASRSRYAALMITDLFGIIDRYNKPGTVGKENWSYRLPFTCAQMQEQQCYQKDLQKLRESIAQFRSEVIPAE